jgi:hypothetical protein
MAVTPKVLNTQGRRARVTSTSRTLLKAFSSEHD